MYSNSKFINIKKAKTKFKTEFSVSDHEVMIEALLKHFKYLITDKAGKTMVYRNRRFLEDALGLAYTSTGIYATYSITNQNVYLSESKRYWYTNFSIDENGNVWAELHDKDSKEYYFIIS